MTSKRRILTLKEKIDIIDFAELHSNYSVRIIAKKFSVGKSCIASLLKNKESLQTAWSNGANKDMKRTFGNSKGRDVDTMTYNWIVEARQIPIPMSGPLIREKAKEFANAINFGDFKASPGWLHRFLKRHNISINIKSVDAAEADPPTVSAWANSIRFLIEMHDSKNIFNAGETALLYNALPGQIFHVKSETCSGGNSLEERLTLLHCVNMSGDVEPLVVIGRPDNAPCFEKTNLQVTWFSNKKACMTAKLMTEWLQNFNVKMKEQNRHVLLFLDNTTSHPHLSLSNVELMFFPANITPACQPLHQGIITDFKVFYREALLSHLIARMGNGSYITELSSQINVFDAVEWAALAWAKVSKKTIQDCFKKSQFPMNERVSNEDFSPEDDMLSTCLKNLTALIRQTGCDHDIECLEYATCDNKVCTDEGPDDNSTEGNRSDDDDDVVEMAEGQTDVTSYTTALTACEALIKFALRNGDETALQLTSNLRSHFEAIVVRGAHLQQSQI